MCEFEILWATLYYVHIFLLVYWRKRDSVSNLHKTKLLLLTITSFDDNVFLSPTAVLHTNIPDPTISTDGRQTLEVSCDVLSQGEILEETVYLCTSGVGLRKMGVTVSVYRLSVQLNLHNCKTTLLCMVLFVYAHIRT